VGDEQRLVVVSADGHCGADLRGYRTYLETRFHADFDAWAASYRDAWADVDGADFEADLRFGPAAAASELNWDSAKRLAFVESQGVAAEVLFPNTSPPFTPSGVISAPGPRSRDEYELRWAGLRANNRWLAEFCADVPGRRAGFAQLFLDDLDEAVAEVRWAATAGLRGVLLPGDHTLKMVNLYYPHLDPLWAVCEELGMPVHRHANVVTEDVGAGGPASPWISALEIPFYSGRGIAHLLCAGVFERFPGLRFVTTEQINGQQVPALLARLDAMYELALGGSPPGTVPIDAAVAGLRHPPSEYFATNCYVAGPLDLPTAHALGTPNLMFGADIPHSEGTAPHTHLALRRVCAGIPEPEVRALVGERAMEVYRLDPVALQIVADRIGPTIAEVRLPLADGEAPSYPDATQCRLFTDRVDPRLVTGSAT
jgi:predicted TIM-barrel fold metal-dependent hydrolase